MCVLMFCGLQASALETASAQQKHHRMSTFAASTAPRKLKRHHGWAVAVCIKLSVPLLICCVFFGLVYLRMNRVTQDTYTSSVVTTVMGDRTVSAYFVA